MASQEEVRPEASQAPPKARLSKPVFVPAVIVIVAALGFATWYGARYGDGAADAFTELRNVIGTNIGWWYIIVVTAMLLFCLWAALSKVGNIRLGRDDERPEFSLYSWFAMLFSAGMGIGLVFSGVSEPLNHMFSPPEVAGVEAGSEEAGRAAIGQSMFHWGLHAWGIYAIVGLGLAYMTFRRGRPLSIRWLLEPIFGRRLIESWVGHVIDVVAIVGTVFGVATSLGMGVLQIQAGLSYQGWFEPSDTLLVVLVLGITALGTISVVTGLHKGLRWLSNANMALATVLAVVVLLVGPTVFLLRSLVQNFGEYLQTIPQLAFVTGAGAGDTWTLDWTLFNQAWFLAWAPFVGMFIARISRGRTIREFILGALLAPTLVSLVWFTIFGSTGVLSQLTDGNLVGGDGAVDQDTALFLLFGELPVTEGIVTVLSVIAIVVITLFFVTSADSCSLVVDVLSHNGRSETPWVTRVFWAVLVGVAGALLLMAGGEAALTVLQVSSLAGAAPLSIVYVLAMVAMWRMFRLEVATMPRYVRIRSQATPSALVEAARENSDTDREMERSLRELLRSSNGHGNGNGNGSSRGALKRVSATLGGLDMRPSASPARRLTPDNTILAVHEVPAHATTVDPETGAIGLDDDGVHTDPTAGEVFDTPEFTDSAVGAEHHSQELLERYVDGQGGDRTDSQGGERADGQDGDRVPSH
ncbi:MULTISPECIES: BCCT family transporter [Prauserella salsuginis group]|uniref:Choline/glycine/proline betaine transport protein n=2 Tax=Prauserella salsuginis group TaxID=2893672 RepID=A0A839XW72_9PSEU|nr:MULTISPECIES: BCCT family transporter [Prauserella salsuginis group]MBB3664035.1 choline/glycine/proline betaine transport protein [Prauserella sediminis]MCR3721490.1 choline/glycine/proline betaine transport protein [Prauserella flava]MCR3734182.1 choline/glycine/proline betaine transport protein [Prauserella salsuginis]